jgi:hypothetical protein
MASRRSATIDYFLDVVREVCPNLCWGANGVWEHGFSLYGGNGIVHLICSMERGVLMVRRSGCLTPTCVDIGNHDSVVAFFRKIICVE